MEVVTVGKTSVSVVPQRHARLRRQLNYEDFAAIMSQDYGHQSYRVLTVLVPDMLTKDDEHPDGKLPEWHWEGFAAKEDWEAWKKKGQDPRPADKQVAEESYSPTTKEIIDLFEAAFRESGATRLGNLLKLAQWGASMNPNNSGDSQTPSPLAMPGVTGA